MSHTSEFLGADFRLATVTQIALATVRVRFTYDPLAASESGANDALNVSNYSISGPADNVITWAAIVPDDPQAIDLTLAGPLALGEWTLTASNSIQTAGARVLQAPLSLQFEVSFVTAQEPVSGGAVNDSAESLIRKHLGPALKGPAWNALIAALAVGDRINWENAKLAFNQLFKISAAGKYLDRKAADDGVSRPPNTGIGDDVFRRLAIKLSTGKLTQQSLLEILEVFYGSDSVRAHIDTELAEPFVLADGYDLELFLDGKDSVRVLFDAGEFNQITQARSVEVAAAITRSFRMHGSKGFAVAVTDTVTGLSRVRIYSPSLGLVSSVQVLGGLAQKPLRFETQIQTPAEGSDPASISWAVTVPEPGLARYTISGASDLDMSLLSAGDYVVVTGANFLPENRGSFTIQDVVVKYVAGTLTQYFDVLNDEAEAQASAVEQNLADVLFFDAVKKTIHVSDGRTVTVAQYGQGELDIAIPATTQAINRTPETAAYLHENESIAVDALARTAAGVVTVTATGHELGVGDQVLVQGVAATVTPPASVEGDTVLGTTTANNISIWSETRPQVQPGAINHGLTLLPDGKVLVSGGQWDQYVTGEYIATDACERFSIVGSSALPGGQVQYSYDWLPTATMTGWRGRHTSTLASTGLVWAVGGTDSSTPFLDSTETYDPDANTWTAGPALGLARYGHTANLIEYAAVNSPIMVVGGQDSDTSATATSELIYPITNTVISGPDLVEARTEHATVVLDAATIDVLAIGGRAMARGHVVDPFTLACWRLDEATGTDPAVDEGPHGMDLGVIVATPGSFPGKVGSARDLYGAALRSAAPNSDAVAALLGEWTVEAWVLGDQGTVLAHGVAASEVEASNRLMNVSFVADTSITWGWERGAGAEVTGTVAMPTGAWGFDWNHIAVVKKAGTGGNYDVLVYLNGQLLQTFTNNLNATGGANGVWFMGAGLEGAPPSLCILDDVRVSAKARTAAEIYRSHLRGVAESAYGSDVAIGEVLSSCERLVGGLWETAPSMTWARTGHQATLLPDGKVLVTGGWGYRGTDTAPTAAAIAHCELFDPETGTWSPAGRMSVARAWHTATYLPAKDQVVVQGGADSAYADIFDVATRTWRRGPLSSTASTFTQAKLKAVAMDEGPIFVNGSSAGAAIDNRPSLLYVPASDSISGGGLNGTFTVTSVDGDDFTYETPGYGFVVGDVDDASIQPVGATSSSWVGPFTFDTVTGASVTAVETQSTQDIEAGRQYTSLAVADATDFPDEPGYVAIAYGTEQSTYPVRYLGRYSSTALSLDYKFRFPTSIDAGASVTLLADKGVFAPTQAPGSFYLTGSAAGRVGAEQALATAQAAGITVNTEIVYPGDRGLGGEGLGVTGAKISDKVSVWGGDNLDQELATAHGDES
jgi:hypothetical protein